MCVEVNESSSVIGGWRHTSAGRAWTGKWEGSGRLLVRARHYGSALFALPPLTCTSPIRPLEGSPNRFTSENEEDFRSSLRGSEDKNLQNSVFGVLLL